MGTSFHKPAGASAVTLFTFSGATAPISKAIHPPSEFPATCISEMLCVCVTSSTIARANEVGSTGSSSCIVETP